ncbi:MAG: hypothetical protein GWO11_04985, partial [Desulfuromonadales bacterium]|nr:hypothetical protein [Desulfuromonadales bacterium]NIR33757.1 hypothetical protein [Desulfuromonadales bacterium]NIS43770.1 hypothetical protein [Desulfuromonadales bacterium]
MKMDLLDTPLRGTWNLCGTDPSLTTDEALGIARRLAEAGLFYMTLEQQPLAHPGFERILAELGGTGIQTSLVFSSMEQERRKLEPGLPVAGLWLDAAPFLRSGAVDRNALEDELQLLRDTGYDPQLLLVPLRENIHLLVELLELCQRLRVGSFKLPNVPIDGSFSSS